MNSQFLSACDVHECKGEEMGQFADPQTIRAASQVLATIDQRHTILEDQDRQLRMQDAALAAKRHEYQACCEAIAAGRLERAELEGEIARLREEVRTAKARLQQETLRVREELRDAQGRVENTQRQHNLALRELETGLRRSSRSSGSSLTHDRRILANGGGGMNDRR
jgi:chromosome segregation ATPase